MVSPYLRPDALSIKPPLSQYESPDAVIADMNLTLSEKRDMLDRMMEDAKAMLRMDDESNRWTSAAQSPTEHIEKIRRVRHKLLRSVYLRGPHKLTH